MVSDKKPVIPKYQKRGPAGPQVSGGRRLSGTGFTNTNRLQLTRPSIATIASVGSLEGTDAEDYANARNQGRNRQSRGSIWDRPRTKSMPRLSIYSLGALETGDDDDEDDDLIDDDLRCGYFGWKPDFLQILNTPGFLLAALGFFNACQGFMINGTLNQITSTLERRFDLSATQVSFINTAYDIFYGVFVLPLGFMAQFKYKPRILGCGALLLSLGACIFVLPHILIGEYKLGTMEWDFTCTRDNNTVDPLCETQEDSDIYMVIFCVAQFFNAMGGVTLQVVAIPMLDENIKSKQLPLYQGINMGVNMLGPAFAATVGSRFLNIYVDVGRVDMDDVVLERTDPAWVGAWWISFCLAAVLLIIAAMILFLFSYETPAAKRNAKFRYQEAHGGRGLRETRNENFGARIMEIPYSMKLLLTNPIVVVATIVATLEVGTVSGLNMFMAKFLQFQFRLSPANASLIMGGTLLPAAVTGLLLGGLIAKKLELKIPGLMKMNIVTGMIALPLCLVFLMKCDKLQLAGIYAPYTNTTAEPLGSLDHPCNVDCRCSMREYKPACGVDNKVYFSPCHAGCAEEHLFKPDDKEQYFGCSCLSEYEAPDWNVGQVEMGVCDTGCTELYIFLAIFFFLVMAQFFGGSTGLSALLRSVPEKERTMAVAVQQLFTRYFGMVPFPLLLAVIFDTACEVFQYKCGEKGSCWVYDSDYLATGLAIWVVCIKLLSTSMYFLAIKFYKPPSDEDADPKNIASDAEMVDHIYARSGSIASILNGPEDQRMSRMDFIEEEEEEDDSSEGSGDIKKVIPANGVIYNNVSNAPVIEEDEEQSSTASSSEGHTNQGFTDTSSSSRNSSSTSVDSIDSGDGDEVQGYTFGGDNNHLSTAL